MGHPSRGQTHGSLRATVLAVASALLLIGGPVAVAVTQSVWHSGLGFVLPFLGAVLAIASVFVRVGRRRPRVLAIVGGVLLAVADFAALLLVGVGRWEG